MLVSTALVLMMSVPALALFYGGMVRSKNMLSMLMQVFVVFSLVTVLWCVYGYSLAFTEGNAFFGNLTDRLFLNGTFDAATGQFAMAATFSKNTPIPELVFVAFQATFAAITCALILGAFAERAKFSAVLLFVVIWFTFAYTPIAHMVWFWPGPDAYTAANLADGLNAKAGLLWQWGALDFAGGTVVHINAGIAGIVGAYVMGKRVGFGREALTPHNLPMTMIGASLLWTGWFGFNAGSALEANNSAALAFMNTYLATACAVLSWMFAEWMFKGKPSMLGAASGAVAGLVAITPAAGNVGIPGAFVIGTAAGVVCLWGVSGLKRMLKVDDTLDVFGVHALGGIMGALLTGDLQRAVPRRPGPRHRLGDGRHRLSGHPPAALDPGQGRRRDHRVVRRGRVHRLQDRGRRDRPARARGAGARGAGRHLPRGDRVQRMKRGRGPRRAALLFEAGVRARFFLVIPTRGGAGLPRHRPPARTPARAIFSRRPVGNFLHGAVSNGSCKSGHF